jgi:hypothetical protein
VDSFDNPELQYINFSTADFNVYVYFENGYYKDVFTILMKCPICQEHKLVTQSLEDCFGRKPDIFCPKVIRLPEGKLVNHYREYSVVGDKVRIFVWPYRIITWKGESQVSVDTKRLKSNKHFFKTIMKAPLSM